LWKTGNSLVKNRVCTRSLQPFARRARKKSFQKHRNMVTREGIREWYDRTTRFWRKGLIWATIVALIGAVIFYVLGSMGVFTRIQTFNGALTIPVGAALWMAAFVFIFLVPSREASFRSQEWIESMVSLVEKAIREQIAPAAKVWIRLGERMESEIPGFIKDIREGIQVIKDSAARLEKAVTANEKTVEDAKPVIEALRRIGERFEKEIKSGLIDEVRQASRAVREFAAPPPAKALPSVDRAIQALDRGPVRPRSSIGV